MMRRPRPGTYVEREVFAFLDALHAAGTTTMYGPLVIREFGLPGDRAMALCAKWRAARQQQQREIFTGVTDAEGERKDRGS